MIITKELVTELKHKENGEIASLINNYRDIGSINFILESLGQLPSGFNSSFLYDLLEHNHSQVRLNAVKNIGKLNGKTNIEKLTELYKKETDTSVRREIISSIGRQRNSINKPMLFNFLEDEDPKIVCQAIRGLLVFGKDNDVIEHLKPLINHPNEMVRTVIYKEYFAKENQSKSELSHTETYDFLKNTVVNADVLEAIKLVPDESVHLTFTSPPYYNARDYLFIQVTKPI
jgi:HEAT repeat protein